MRVLQLCLAPVEATACRRLHNALLENGIESDVLLLRGDKSYNRVHYYNATERQQKTIKICSKINGRLLRGYRFKKSYVFPFNTGFYGMSVVNHPLVRDADIIHLHWICNFVSVWEVRKLKKLGKPIVWTFHDQWPTTGGCHYSFECRKWQTGCGHCNAIASKRKYDITWMVSRVKRWCLKGITVLGPSTWMKNNADESYSTRKCNTFCIPNAIDTKVFRPCGKATRDFGSDSSVIKVLFGAVSAKIPYKGYGYLLEMLERLNADSDWGADIVDRLEIHILGEYDPDNVLSNRFKSVYHGFVSDNSELAQIYSSMDVLVYPSIQDNLPCMVMESLACGTPVLCFATGGISDMVEHKVNGYVAKYKDIDDFVAGFRWILENNKDNVLGRAGVKKVQENYSNEVVALRHIELYKSLLEK